MMELSSPSNTERGATQEQEIDDESNIILHPLSIDLILENVFRFCNFKQLNTCRQVNHHWYQISLPVWSKKAPKLFLCGKNSNKSHDMEILLDTLDEQIHRQSESHQFFGLQHYKKFKIANYVFDCNAPLLTRFWIQYGTWVTQLQLHNFTFLDFELFRNVMFCEFTPNLVKLDVNLKLSFKGDREKEEDFVLRKCKAEFPCLNPLRSLTFEGKRIPITWSELFLQYPNLQELTIGGFRDSWQWDPELHRIFTAIKRIRGEDKEKLNLNELNVLLICYGDRVLNLPPSVLKMLGSMEDLHLTLQTLRIDFGQQASDPAMGKIVNLYAKSLKTLTIGRDVPLPDFTLPVMNSLEDLTLIGCILPDLSFLKNVQNLKKLTLKKTDNDETDEEQYPEKNIIQLTKQQECMEGLVIPSMVSFSCDYFNYQDWTEEDIRSLHGWMPNLKELHLELDNDTFRIVCECWPDLEELRISGSVDDEGITGIPEDFEKANFNPNDESCPETLNCEIATDDDSLVTWKNNIRKLLKLRSFTMLGMGEDNLEGADITKKSVIHGFLKLPCLERIQLGVEKTLDESVIQMMKEKIDSVRVTYATDNDFESEVESLFSDDMSGTETDDENEEDMDDQWHDVDDIFGEDNQAVDFDLDEDDDWSDASSQGSDASMNSNDSADRGDAEDGEAANN